MRLPALTAALVTLAVPALASARPVTAGVGLGLTESKADAQGSANVGASSTLSLYGRLGLVGPLSGQLELARIHTDDDGMALRTASLLAPFDLRHGHLVPLVLVGGGIDIASSQYGGEIDAHHLEAGLGLEYRAGSGLVIGADARIGTRTVDSNSLDQPVPAAGPGIIARYAPGRLRDGEYRSLRLTVGLRF